MLGLKAAGAVIIGKTTTTEFGWKTPGDCPLHGITRNPWNRERTPGGSSSGAGAAGAACFGPLHVGTDAGGSIRIPAAYCGLVGMKPSFGRVPQWPHGAFSGVACAGPMARTVRDAALMLSAMAQPDLRDPFCLPDEPRDWRHGIEDGVAGLRVALVRRLGFDPPLDAEGEAALAAAARLLEEAGAIVEEADPGLPDTRAVFGRVWGVALARLVATLPPERRELLDAGLAEVAEREAGMSAVDFLGAEALRIEAAHAMARFHQRFDLRADRRHADRRLRRRPAHRPPARGAVARLGALDLRLQPDPPAGGERAGRARRGRDAARGAGGGGALPRRPGAARGAGDRARDAGGGAAPLPNAA